MSDEDFRRDSGILEKTRKALWSALATLSEPQRVEFQKRYATARISVRFIPSATVHDRKAALPLLYAWMAGQQIDGVAAFQQLPTNVARAIDRVDVQRPSPFLMIEPDFGTWIQAPALDIVDEKIKKEYVTHHPMELLLYMWTPLVLPADAWLERHGQLLRDKIDRSNFRRVWVFDAPSRFSGDSIILVHQPRPITVRA